MTADVLNLGKQFFPGLKQTKLPQKQHHKVQEWLLLSATLLHGNKPGKECKLTSNFSYIDTSCIFLMSKTPRVSLSVRLALTLFICTLLWQLCDSRQPGQQSAVVWIWLE